MKKDFSFDCSDVGQLLERVGASHWQVGPVWTSVTPLTGPFRSFPLTQSGNAHPNQQGHSPQFKNLKEMRSYEECSPVYQRSLFKYVVSLWPQTRPFLRAEVVGVDTYNIFRKSQRKVLVWNDKTIISASQFSSHEFTLWHRHTRSHVDIKARESWNRSQLSGVSKLWR